MEPATVKHCAPLKFTWGPTAQYKVKSEVPIKHTVSIKRPYLRNL